MEYSGSTQIALIHNAAHLDDIGPFLDYGMNRGNLPRSYRGKGRDLVFRVSNLREELDRAEFGLIGDLGIAVVREQEYVEPMDIFLEEKNPTIFTLPSIRVAWPQDALFEQLAAKLVRNSEEIKKDYFTACLHLLYGYIGRGTELNDPKAIERSLKLRA